MSDQAQTTLPAGTGAQAIRQQWSCLAAKLKEKQRLNHSDWAMFLELTRTLEDQRAETDPDWFEEARKAGAFRKDQVPRSTQEEVKARIELVATWMEEGRSHAWMVKEAIRRWGVGYFSLIVYRKRAAAILDARVEARLKSVMSVALSRVDVLFRYGVEHNDPKAIADSLEALRKMTGLDKPIVQRIEMSSPSGGPLAVLQMPERKPIIDVDSETEPEPKS